MVNQKYFSARHNIPNFRMWSSGLGMEQLLSAAGLNESNVRLYRIATGNPELDLRYGYLLVGRTDREGMLTYIVADLSFAAGGRVHPHFYLEVDQFDVPKNIKERLSRFFFPLSSGISSEADLIARVAKAFGENSLPLSKYGLITNPSDVYKGTVEVRRGPKEELNAKVDELLWAYERIMSGQGRRVTTKEFLNS